MGSGTYDWSKPRFIPLDIKMRDGAVSFCAGGETLTLKGTLFKIEVTAPVRTEWELRNSDFITFSLKLVADRDTLLKRVLWLEGNWETPYERLVQSTNLQDNFLFLRKGNTSFFFSLDFPFSKIAKEGISYAPYRGMSDGEVYHCHTMSVGACKLSGTYVGKYDRAEIEAVSAYVEQRFPLRFKRPMLISTCITNRMTDTREGRIFYSMFDNPTLFLDPDLLERDIQLSSEVGIEYFQVFEGVFDWPDQNRTGASLRRIVKFANERGVRVGDYIHPGELYCPHYNYEHRHLDRPDWRQLDSKGDRQQLCLGCNGYLEFLRESLVSHNRKYSEELICMDMLQLQPCYDTHHGHPEGDVYHQILGLVSLMQSLSEISPNYLVWTNSGNWLELMPKLVWFNPNVYLTDPHTRHYGPNLNMLKFMGDTRREQMVSVHNEYFVPYRFYTNCEYYFSRRSRVHDLRFFEYSLLQGLAVTPNLCLGEYRTFLDRIPCKNVKGSIEFLEKWIGFIKENFSIWNYTIQVGDPPGTNSAEIYSHIVGDHGFICLVNQNPFPTMAHFKLDGSVGLADGREFELFEVYPNECLIAEHPLPFAEFGEQITCRMRPQSVRYIEVRPYTKSPSSLRIYGLPARVDKRSDGYQLNLCAQQGEVFEVGLVFPGDEAIDKVTAQQAPSVPMFTFPSAVKVLDKVGNIARLELAFPREKAPRELTHWRVSPDNINVVLPMPNNFPFLGALVSGAFSEDYQIQLDISTKKLIQGACDRRLLGIPSDRSNDAGAIAFRSPINIFETEFKLPFSEWSSFAPGYEDDVVIELAFSTPEVVHSIFALINGKPVPVHRYNYATKPDWFEFYIEANGNVQAGAIHLSLEVTWSNHMFPMEESSWR